MKNPKSTTIRIPAACTSALAAVLICVAVPQQAEAQFTFAADNGGNYGGGWTNGANGGAGFTDWTISTAGGGFKGAFIGDPSSAGIGPMSSTSFGLFANSASDARVFADRSLSTAMQVGDTFTFQWGINFDGGGFGRDKGFRLYTGGAPGSGTQIIDVVNGGSSDIFFNANNVGFGYGTNVMTWTFTYTNATTLAVSANDRDGSGTFTTNITVAGGISGYRLYATNLDSGDQRQPYYNNFQNTNSGVYNIGASANHTEARTLSGSGNLAKAGAGTLTITANNNFTGATTISNGVVNLNTAGGGALGSTASVAVQSGGVLLISQNSQINDSASITLSGGTLLRAAGVSEAMGNLSLTTGSTIDFGSGATGTLSFGTYSPVSKLTITSFLEGNILRFNSNLTSSINNTSLFDFDNAFTSNWNGSTFTITAIPEPSTVVAALGLAGLLLWPARRRLLHDAQSILGLRAPARDRLAARSHRG